MSLTDDAAAAQAIHALDALTPDQRAAQADLARILHADTPFVDVHELFALVDTLYFRATLRARVEVSWSSRLTLYVLCSWRSLPLAHSFLPNFFAPPTRCILLHISFHARCSSKGSRLPVRRQISVPLTAATARSGNRINSHH